MIEIAAHQRPPLAPLLAIAAIALALSLVVARLRFRAWVPDLRTLAVAALAALLLTGAGIVARSERDSGTGTQSAWGWPRAVYTRWASWDTSEESEHIRWVGIFENVVTWAGPALLLATLARRRRRDGAPADAGAARGTP